MWNTTQLKEFVKLGYNDYSVDFKTRTLNLKDAIRVIKLVKDYNNFNGEKVATAIQQIRKIWGSDYQLSFEFGREGSPVLYVSLPYWKNKKEKYTEAERKEKTELSLAVLKATQTDELWEENNKIRAWWD